jgi:hypothetical protein
VGGQMIDDCARAQGSQQTAVVQQDRFDFGTGATATCCNKVRSD